MRGYKRNNRLAQRPGPRHKSTGAVRQFAWLEVDSDKMASLVPATSGYPLQGVTQTQTVRWLISPSRGMLKGFELEVLLTNGGPYGSLDLYDKHVTRWLHRGYGW